MLIRIHVIFADISCILRFYRHFYGQMSLAMIYGETFGNCNFCYCFDEVERELEIDNKVLCENALLKGCQLSPRETMHT